MIARRDAIALGLAATVALAMPAALLSGGDGGTAGKAAQAPPPLGASAVPPLAAAYERSLFGAPQDAQEAEIPADAPQLVGVVGRLGADAVALVRTPEGGTRTLRIGEAVDGWQLASLAIDAAFFTRGAERVRVPLPAGDPGQ
ncbi:hypothetical protein TS85_10810 [Sphingomonas hengshuiensis]|uniref:General secretion pathway protein GspN n=1 Tax=Sphingomonas hengshuiensis TaxID=1609977 RepID=A0A7U5BFS1_9SPHN|nr:hypothetical protein TS85_10810 [Sphingomonas hengshuiensis]